MVHRSSTFPTSDAPFLDYFTMRLLFLALFYSRIIHAVGAIGFIDIVGALQPKLSSNASIYLPDDTQFSNLTDRWSRYEAPSFLAVVEVAVEADVEAIVRKHLKCWTTVNIHTGHLCQ